MNNRGHGGARFITLPCRKCGKSMKVGARTKNAPRCHECGIQAAYDSMRQMRAGEGEYFERWKAGVMRKINERGTGTLPPDLSSLESTREDSPLNPEVK